MPRGSRPGERRGRRRRETPNHRTVLTDRILVSTFANPKVSSKELIAILVNDEVLPANARIAVARQLSPSVIPRENGRGSRKSSVIAEARGASSIQNGGVKANAATARAAARQERKGAGIFAAVDLLLRVAQDVTASLVDRRKAARQAAEYFLPKNRAGANFRQTNMAFPSTHSLCGTCAIPNWS
jgi:hypothetical protein